MKASTLWRHSALAVAMLCALWLGTARAQTAALPVADDFHDGDRWTWRRVDDLTHVETPGGIRTVIGRGDAIAFRLGGGDYTLEQVFVEGVGRGHAAGKPFRVWPLRLGSKWQFDAEWDGSIGTGWTKQDAEVVAFEEVTVPAGRFMAFRIEYHGFWVARGVASHRGFEGPQDDVFWYAPSIHSDIRHTRRLGSTHFTDELVSFTPGPPRP